jgi:protein ImuB
MAAKRRSNVGTGAPEASPWSLFAALFVPDFQAAVLTRGHGDGSPCAVVEGEPPHQLVCCADEGARAGGVAEGMPLAAAVARFSYTGGGELRILERDARAERATQQALLRLAESVTPRFEDAAPGLLLLDFHGLRDPHAAAETLARDAAKLGLSAQIGVARNRFVALCAARTQPGVTHIYPGEEAGFLEVQGLEILPLSENERRTLERWGVRMVGELARLPDSDLTARFGERGACMARWARGEDAGVLRAWREPPQLEISQELDWELAELEPLALVLSGALDKLCLRLQSCQLAAARLHIRLKLAQGRAFERSLSFPQPLTDARALLELARIDLAAHPPGDAVVGVRVSVTPAERRRLQFSLFAPDLPAPEKLAVTLARLTALTGEDRVGAPVLADSHRPGAAVLTAFAPVEIREQSQETRDQVVRGGLAFRVFRPPWPARVELRQSRPTHLQTLETAGPVTARSGPWRVSGEWWTPEGFQYEEWDVEAERRLYRICFDRQSGVWCVTGMYD